ncbi:polysaccharide pyruvyl transferase family protein [Acetobacter orleanensis]|uniref:Polysaccharide pyruvyl transferase domain-containing protein n=1 Tax=Acetobacter orleanensis TaxID=104099 RepID=A0A4Y3TSU6_9PROT|nr:polysaccharide pyruvyl transferase family protein [Acetobacter orleanensis]KXV66476.1 hypothetical protein AD949_02415 [Acetobacter orleanensis]PCD78474.1 hypothetical protein CO710_12015 [Acetobacter orleanensis]GAN69217.1 hypothetical protein Abol_029_013 [Acetobacter orleanensis JCM 7639]GBR24920.1 hypothetical protein AA0473_0760 [Acetobacter orleanensis NRIC 0473]GEB83825.1 hypothetical protein AOR01nite_23020 [Acetobacter orleanensis]
MNANFKNIRQTVREEIRQHPVLIDALKRFADHNAVFYPGYGNLGDALIAVGTADLFDDLDWAPEHIYGSHKGVLSGHSHVVMGGGGGWVKGLWEGYREQTLEFLRNGGQMLILPSSFAGFGAEFVPYADQLLIFCREQWSYKELLQQGMPEERVFLCSDLAFYTKEHHFSDLDRKGHYPLLKILRRDEESACKNRPRDSVDLPLLFNGIQWAKLDECLPPLRAVAGIIGQFECVETDRLHMAILSTLLGRIVTVEPSNYFKIKGVFEYTLHRFPTVSFQETVVDQPVAELSEVESIRQLKRELQAEWEQRTIVLRRNDALSECVESLQGRLNEAVKQTEALSEEKRDEIRQKEDIAHRLHCLEEDQKRKDYEYGQVCQTYEEVCQEKDRHFEQICQEKDQYLAQVCQEKELQFNRACQEKDRNFDQICQELASLSQKRNRDLENALFELEKIRSSRLHRLNETYYALFNLPGVGLLLRGVRKILIGFK